MLTTIPVLIVNREELRNMKELMGPRDRQLVLTPDNNHVVSSQPPTHLGYCNDIHACLSHLACSLLTTFTSLAPATFNGHAQLKFFCNDLPAKLIAETVYLYAVFELCVYLIY